MRRSLINSGLRLVSDELPLARLSENLVLRVGELCCGCVLFVGGCFFSYHEGAGRSGKLLVLRDDVSYRGGLLLDLFKFFLNLFLDIRLYFVLL